MERRFQDKVALVTGAGSGIGRAAALAFAAEGARVVAADVSPAEGEETVRRIRAAGGEAVFVAADVSDAAQVEQLVARATAAYGRLDCAHNNAGILGARRRAAEYSEEEWDRVVAVNLRGVWLCMRQEIPQMLRQGGGAIVNTASVAGLVGLRRFAAYSASKHAILGLTKSAALEYFPHGVRINAVCPGVIDTELLRGAVAGERPDSALGEMLGALRHTVAKKVLAAKEPARRLGLPEEVAQAVLWLCSDAASYVNGHALVVDGGAVAK